MFAAGTKNLGTVRDFSSITRNSQFWQFSNYYMPNGEDMSRASAKESQLFNPQRDARIAEIVRSLAEQGRDEFCLVFL